jgi:hypothetical protein
MHARENCRDDGQGPAHAQAGAVSDHSGCLEAGEGDRARNPPPRTAVAVRSVRDSAEYRRRNIPADWNPRSTTCAGCSRTVAFMVCPSVWFSDAADPAAKVAPPVGAMPLPLSPLFPAPVPPGDHGQRERVRDSRIPARRDDYRHADSSDPYRRGESVGSTAANSPAWITAALGLPRPAEEDISGHTVVRCTTDGCHSAWYRPQHYPPQRSALPRQWRSRPRTCLGDRTCRGAHSTTGSH